MAYASDSEFLARIPAVSVATSDQRAFALSDAAALIDDVVFGDITARAHTLLAAHFLALAGVISGGAAGQVSGRSAGEISVSYAVTAYSDPTYASTTYGRQFLEIAARVGHSLLAVGE